jgi:indole-3-glycerol phosphate synthase
MSSGTIDHLGRIVARKRMEVARRRRRSQLYERLALGARPIGHDTAAALRRQPGQPPKVIAEIKLRSPSAGQIRPRRTGELPSIAQAYAEGGASAVSVLCDGPGFGGSVLDVARVAKRIRPPVLFKEFVLDAVQLDAARAAGATFVLLLVRVLDDVDLTRLIDAARARGLEPVVEAADAAEVQRALRTSAVVIGVNARDLRNFQVDASQAAAIIGEIPADRIAVFMSGVRTAADFAKVAATRADAVLIGEGLMRHERPGDALRAMLSQLG